MSGLTKSPPPASGGRLSYGISHVYAVAIYRMLLSALSQPSIFVYGDSLQEGDIYIVLLYHSSEWW